MIESYIWKSSIFSNIETWNHVILLQTNSFIKDFEDSDQSFSCILHFLITFLILINFTFFERNYFSKHSSSLLVKSEERHMTDI